MKTVLITGAEGNIGSHLRRFLAGVEDEAGPRYEVRCLTREPVPGLDSTVADIAELDAVLPALAGVDAVVHLAGSPQVESPWEDVLHNNLIGTYNVFEAARRQGVRQLVFASSNHAVGMFEVEGMPALYRRGTGVMVDHRVPVRPDSLYGVSKAYGEALGRYFSEQHGLAVYCLRIGFVPPPTAAPAAGGTSTSPMLQGLTSDDLRRRRAAVWMSHDDLAGLVDACLRAEQVRFGIYYGVSDNPYRFWSLDNARANLGWWPRDAAPEP